MYRRQHAHASLACREANDSLARQMTLGDSLEKRLRELTIELETKERELTDKSRDQVRSSPLVPFIQLTYHIIRRTFSYNGPHQR